MLTKRIIPCLDVKEGVVVKGNQFGKLIYAGDALELAKRYYEEGADELVFLDITATLEKRKAILELVKEVSKSIYIPYTVGGGIRTISDIKNILYSGADKVSINTSAIKNPFLINRASEIFGSQAIVVALDAKRYGNKWRISIKGGTEMTDIDAIEWAKEVEKRGAGELLVTSMDRDGTKEGYDLELLENLSNLSIPVIASGGAGDLESIYQALKVSDAALAASIFHFNKIKILELKNYLKQKGLQVRL